MIRAKSPPPRRPPAPPPLLLSESEESAPAAAAAASEPLPQPATSSRSSKHARQSKRSLSSLANLGRMRVPEEIVSASASASASPPQPQAPPPRPRAQISSSSSSSIGLPTPSASDDDDDSGGDDAPPHTIFQEDPIEKEIQKQIRKAKLMARIDQLAARGIAKSKQFNHKTSEDELLEEVARMEVLAQRDVRIKQGRAMFIGCVGGSEKTMNFFDDKSLLPFNLKFHMKDFTRATVKDITNYDDCLERGITAIFGPGSQMPWWVELLWILIPAMITHSMMNRFKDPEHTNAVLKQNPQLQAQVAENIARQQMAAAQQQPPVPPRPTNTAVMQMQPPPRPMSTLTNREEVAPQFDPAQVAARKAEVEMMQQLTRQNRQMQEQNSRMESMQRQMEQMQQRIAQQQQQASAASANVASVGNNLLVESSEDIDIVIE